MNLFSKRLLSMLCSFYMVIPVFSALTSSAVHANGALVAMMKEGAIHAANKATSAAKVGAGLLATAATSAGVTKMFDKRAAEEAVYNASLAASEGQVEMINAAVKKALEGAAIEKSDAVATAIQATKEAVAQEAAKKLAQEAADTLAKQALEQAAEETAKWAVWNSIKENSAQAMNNLACAGYNVLMLVPRCVKYVTGKAAQELAQEANIVSEQLKNCPALTIALAAGTTYFAYKRYNMVQKEKESVIRARRIRMAYEEQAARANIILPILQVPVVGPYTPGQVGQNGANMLGRPLNIAPASIEQLYRDMIEAEKKAGDPRITKCAGTALRFCGII